MKIDREKFAAEAGDEIEAAINRHPTQWVDEIIEHVEDPEEILLQILKSACEFPPQDVRAVVFQKLVAPFAKKVGESAYGSLSMNPGLVTQDEM